MKVAAADVPAGELTVKVRSPAMASGATVMVTGRLVSVPPEAIVAVTPVPMKVTAVAPARLKPVIVADTVEPRDAEGTEMPVIRGRGAGACVSGEVRNGS